MENESESWESGDGSAPSSVVKGEIQKSTIPIDASLKADFVNKEDSDASLTLRFKDK